LCLKTPGLEVTESGATNTRPRESKPSVRKANPGTKPGLHFAITFYSVSKLLAALDSKPGRRGDPHVEKLVVVNPMLFKVSDNKEDFKRNYMKAFPKKGDQYERLPPAKQKNWGTDTQFH
jgi:hypothetical protein